MIQAIRAFAMQEDINFLLTNRIPRQLITRFMGWFSRLENPLICKLSIATWKVFTDLDLSEAKKQHFSSLHDCFIRELKPGSRPQIQDASILTSPCDAIIGSFGHIEETTLLQTKGFPYTLESLCCNHRIAEEYRNGFYVTLRLTSSMYHHFHAPADSTIESVTYISGDTWNVNPVALKRIENLFCKNERALVRLKLDRNGHSLMLIPVAAILVASIRLNFLDVLLHLKYRGPNFLACNNPVKKGDELGYFQHGSSMILLAPPGYLAANGIRQGMTIRMGQALMQIPANLTPFVAETAA